MTGWARAGRRATGVRGGGAAYSMLAGALVRDFPLLLRRGGCFALCMFGSRGVVVGWSGGGEAAGTGAGLGGRRMDREPGGCADLPVRRGVAADLRNAGNTLPQPLQDVELLLAPERAPEERRERIRQTLREMLGEDGRRWTGEAGLPGVVEDLLLESWRIDTRHQRDVPRDWDSLIALAFVEKLKSDERMRTIFEVRLLARLAAAAPELGGMAQWPKFVEQLGPGLQRVEDSLGRILQGMERLEEGVAGLTGKVDALPEVLKTVMEDLVRQYAWGSANRSGLTTEEEGWEAQERELRGVRDDSAESEGRYAEVMAALREALVERLRERDRAFAAEHQKQLAGLGVEGDEEMAGLLRRFAEGDRVGAMTLIERTKRAAMARNAGELGLAKLWGVWREAQELDPGHHWEWVELGEGNPASAEARRDLMASFAKLGQMTGEREHWQWALAVAMALEAEGRLAPRDPRRLGDRAERAGDSGPVSSVSAPALETLCSSMAVVPDGWRRFGAVHPGCLGA